MKMLVEKTILLERKAIAIANRIIALKPKRVLLMLMVIEINV